ncbi:hypothetical protein B0H19DRAFT_1085738 [Mycena capillaripes]|nr:hypothetical protein B0H19DRAFT_1085738 [Mycena capillaripes]
MADLPLELLQHVAEDVGDDLSLFNLRFVSKTLNCVVTPLAFRVVVVRDSVKSAQAVSFLQDETSGEAGREALSMVFSGLAKFPCLKFLRLHFHKYFEEEFTDAVTEDPSHFLLLQNQIFATLAANPPPPLVALTLNNIIAKPNPIYVQEDFQRIFLPLKELEISGLSYVNGECASYCGEPLVEFWSESVAHMVCSAQAVTALTIRTDQRVEVTPLPNTGLPHLTSLVFQQFRLGPDSDVVEFILSHKATLARLELYDCYIDGGTHIWTTGGGIYPVEETKMMRCPDQLKTRTCSRSRG